MAIKDQTAQFAKWFSNLSPAEQDQACQSFDEATGGTLSSYRNPKPVVVAMVPVDTDEGRRLLGVRRTIAPANGSIAMPGGFMGMGEGPQFTAYREVLEEAGLDTSPRDYVVFGNPQPAGNGTLLIFMRYTRPITRAQFKDLAKGLAEKGDGEASELALIEPGTQMGFSLHQHMAFEFFHTRDNQGEIRA